MKKILLFIFILINIVNYGFENNYYKYKTYKTRILPITVATDEYGNIYVGDRFTNSVIKYNAKGKYQFSFGRKRETTANNYKVYALITDIFIRDKNLYLLDVNFGISIFDLEGNIKNQIEFKEGNLLGEVKKPQSLFVDNQGQIYITDTENNRIQIFTKDGEPGRQFGYRGNLPGNFIFPKGITVDKKNIIVADTLNARVCVYDTDGFYEQDIDIDSEYGEYDFIVPEVIFYDIYENKIYTVDNGSEQIKIFNEDYELEFIFGEKGKKNNQFNSLKDVWVDRDKIYVADSLNYCIKIFKKDYENMRLVKIIGKKNIVFLVFNWILIIFTLIFLIMFFIKKIVKKIN